MTRQEVEVVLVALERGSDWLPVIKSRHSEAPDIVAVIQQSDEPLDSFALRVIEKVRALQSQPRRAMRAAFCTSAPSGSDSVSARASIASALLACVAGYEDGELLLTGNEALTPEGRAELFALAGTLLARGSSSPGITVTFGPQEVETFEAQSGVYAKADIVDCEKKVAISAN